ncbi:BCCT family transporter, partial [Pseudomonas sp. 2995-3]|uniref:BCCT family transporter n=1 Tax=Pseudomonas sp. 2995-3 TaxID=1712680 RepID=UPI001C44D25A
EKYVNIDKVFHFHRLLKGGFFVLNKLTPVFTISFAIAIAFILWGVIAPGDMRYVTEAIQGFITEQFGWFYLLAASSFLL